jgi:anti-anti-sigma factor
VPQPSSSDCTVTVSAIPDERCAAVRIVGEIDSGAAPLLASSVRLLSRMSPNLVLIDVGDVEFAGAALPNFLATVHCQLPPDCCLVVCNPAPMVRWLLQATGITQIVSIRDHSPHR